MYCGSVRRTVAHGLHEMNKAVRHIPGDSINISVPPTTVTDASDKKASAGTYTCPPKS